MKLKSLVDELVEKLESVNYLVNRAKSVIDEPVETIEYLGVIWDSKGIKREDKVNEKLDKILRDLEVNVDKEKDHADLEKIVGFLNYYLKL